MPRYDPLINNRKNPYSMTEGSSMASKGSRSHTNRGFPAIRGSRPPHR